MRRASAGLTSLHRTPRGDRKGGRPAKLCLVKTVSSKASRRSRSCAVYQVWSTGLGQFGQLGDKIYSHVATPKAVKDARLITEREVRAARGD
jgi:hypothetical protein